MKITDFVCKGNYVQFDSYRNGMFYYYVSHKVSSEKFQLQVPIEDVTGVTLLSRDKSVTFMRWIRKSIQDKTFIKYVPGLA